MRHGLVALALIAATLFLPRLARRLRRTNPATIGIDVLEQRLARGESVPIIDVRGPDEYNGELGHIPGSVNIPLPELQNRLVELKDLKGRPILLVCRTDKRSAKAAAVLNENGFSPQVLIGGMEQWKSHSAAH